MSGLMPPPETDSPFFAYGIFRPGQLGFFQIKPYVQSVQDGIRIKGDLLLRDGLPILDQGGTGQVTGSLLKFVSGKNRSAAYERISNMEPEKQYRWGELQIDGAAVNVLFGKSPGRSTCVCEESEWDGWKDPLFTAALDVVAETLESQASFEWDLKPSFRLQMAYLLLWSSIERYVALRYHFRAKVAAKVNQLASEPAFVDALKEQVKEPRKIHRADDPTESALRLDKANPKEAVQYYYQVRSNITHRGKGASRDHDLVRESGTELLAIFRKVLAAAQNDARFGEG